MNNYRRYLWPVLLFMIWITGFGWAQSVNANELQSVYLHKQTQRDTQTEMTGINDVEFTVFDITAFLASYQGSQTEAIASLTRLPVSLFQNKTIGEALRDYPEVVTAAKGVTDTHTFLSAGGTTVTESGVLPLQLAKTRNGQDASYLFIETVKAEAIPVSGHFVVSFPVMDESTNMIWTGALHIYPKEELEEVPSLPTIQKELLEEKQDFSYGDTISYSITLTIPEEVQNYTSFSVTDQPAAGLITELASIQVTIENCANPQTYYMPPAEMGNGFILEFIPEKISQLPAGTRIRIDISMVIKEGTTPDQPLKNTATLAYSINQQEHVVDDESIAVFTGGYRFVKVDADHQQTVLPGARFVVKNRAGNYLTTDYKWKTSHLPAKDMELFQLVSNQQGVFSITGLAYGDYSLEEIQAPQSYQLLQYEVPFTVDKYTFMAGDTPADALLVLNKQERKLSGSNMQGTGRYPSTGEQRAGMTTLWGILLLVLTAIIYRKHRRQQVRNQ